MFRNKEIRRIAILYLIIVSVTTAAGFQIGTMAGVLELLSACLLGIIFYMFTGARYQRIAKLSEQIDLVLHNSEHLYISEAEEGELAILQSEILKMTLRIREQNDALKKKKASGGFPRRYFTSASHAAYISKHYPVVIREKCREKRAEGVNKGSG